MRRGQQSGVLRAHTAGLLPPLRVHHGDPAAGRQPRQPDPHSPRPGIPARRARGHDRDGAQQGRPRMGRGLLPGLRLDPVRPDRGVGLPTEIPAGPNVTPAPPSPSSSASGEEDPDPSRRPGLPAGQQATPPGPDQPADRTLFIVLTVMLALVVLAIAVAAWARGPRGEVSPESAWQTLSRTASRLGLGHDPLRRSTSTRPRSGSSCRWQKDLRTVAEAKVETAYAGARLGGARLDAVRDATRRLRISMLRLALRRPRRRRRH